MTDPVPARVTDHLVVRRGDEVIEATRVVEYARPLPPDRAERAALPSGEPRGYDPERDSPVADTALHLTATGPARRALPPAPLAPPARRRWWLW